MADFTLRQVTLTSFSIRSDVRGRVGPNERNDHNIVLHTRTFKELIKSASTHANTSSKRSNVYYQIGAIAIRRRPRQERLSDFPVLVLEPIHRNCEIGD